MPRAAHTAVRTCVACRRRFAASSLLRLTLVDDGVLTADFRHAAPGRGAWVCWNHGCLSRLEERPGMAARSLRRRPRTCSPLVEPARHHAEQRAIEALSQCHRAGLTRTTASQRARVSRERAAVLLRPVGVAARTEGPGLPEIPVPWSSQTMGAALDLGPRSRVLLLHGAPTRRLLSRLRLCAALG